MRIQVISALCALGATLLPVMPASAADPLAGGAPERSKNIIVGSADFPESQLIATIYAQALAAKGVAVDTKMNIGSREVYMPALADGSVDLLPEYSGALLSYLDKNASAHTPAEVAKALKGALPKSTAMLTPSPAQDTDVLAVTRANATKYKLKTIADLKPHAGELVLGGPPEWKSRKEGVVGLKEEYGLSFKSFKTLDVAGPLTVSALVNGQVQAADMFSTDPAMTANNFVALEDTKSLFPAQNIVPIIAAARVNDNTTKVLDAVSAALTTEDLIAMNGRLAEHESFEAVAKDWLVKHKLN